MTDQEKFNAEVQIRLAKQDAKFELFMDELKQQREDMRRLQDRQDAMQIKHDADMKAAQAKHDKEMHEMNQRFYEKVDTNAKEFTKQLHSNFVQTMIGVGAIMTAIGGLIIAALK